MGVKKEVIRKTRKKTKKTKEKQKEPEPVKTVAVEPSPEEIREMCLEIQSTWSDEVRERRVVGRTGEVEVKVCKDNGY